LFERRKNPLFFISDDEDLLGLHTQRHTPIIIMINVFRVGETFQKKVLLSGILLYIKMAANHSGEVMILKLREYRNQGSITCRRMCDGYALVDCLNVLPSTLIGTEKQFLLGQRVQVASCLTSDGTIALYSGTSFGVVFDDGSRVDSISADDMIELTKEEDQRFDYVSRIVWANAMTENRLPLSSEQIRGDRCAWGLCESIFQLTEPWNEQLWTSPCLLTIDTFSEWLYLFAESIRMKITGGLLYALRVIEECTKHLSQFEKEYSDDDNHLITTGVAEMIKYCPSAVVALGNINVEGKTVNGGFSLLRFMVSTQAIKTLKAVYRNPVQNDQGIDGASEVDKGLIKTRFSFYCTMQRVAEDELRSVNCAGIFGDGQSDCNSAWLASLQSDAAAVCRSARRAIQLSDVESNNDFVSAKARCVSFIYKCGRHH
jgi:hypothetical protein